MGYNEFMKVLIAYATNSGGTFFATQIVEQVIKSNKHSVTRKEIEELSATNFKEYDLIIFASPSWNYKGAEGELQTSFKEFVQDFSGKSLASKKCAVFGLGDSTYLYFCGAVDRLERFVKDTGGILLSPSLRIDGYYRNEQLHNKILEDWTEKIIASYSIV